METIVVWKCPKCGRIFRTVGDAERHKGKCKYKAPVLEGQMKLDDYVKTKLLLKNMG